MKKALAVMTALLLVAAGAWAGTTWYFGKQTEKQYRVLLERFEKIGYGDAKVESYERGLREARVRTRFSLPFPVPIEDEKASETLSFVLEQNIRHGPFPGGEVQMQPAQAVVATRVFLDPQLRKHLVETLGGFPEGPLMTGTTVFHLDGKGASRIEVPPFRRTFGTEDPVTIAWQGLTGKASFAPDFKQVAGTWQSPGLSLKDNAGGQIRLEAMKVDFDLHEGLAGLFLGNVTYGVGAMKVDMEKVEEPFRASLSGLKLRNETQAAGETVHSLAHLDLEQAVVDGSEYGPGSFEMHLRNLDAATLARLQQAQRDLFLKIPGSEELSEQETAAIQNAYMQALKSLLTGSPELEISELRFQTADGKLQGTAQVSVDGAVAARGLLAVPAAIEARADLAVTEALLRRMLAGTIRSELDQTAAAGAGKTPNKAELDALVAGRVEQRLQALVAGNILVRDEDELRLSASYRKGEAKLNGRSMPLPGAAQ